MSDCVFHAYSAHARYFGITTQTKHIFNEMRSLCLNGHGGFNQSGYGRDFSWEDYWDEADAQADALDMKDEDLISDANGLIDGTHDYMRTDKWLNDFFDGVVDPNEREEYVEILLNEGIVVQDAQGQVSPAPKSGEILIATPEQQKTFLAKDKKAIIPHRDKKRKRKNKKYADAEPWWREYVYERPRSGLNVAYTPAGIVPWIIETIARVDGFGIRVQNRDWWPKEVYIEEANNDHATSVIKNSNYGEEVTQVTLEPAIYCMQSSKHAQFGTKVPQGVCVMAVQLYPLDDDRVIPAPKKGKRLKTWRRNKK